MQAFFQHIQEVQMSDRVLSTATAREAIERFQRIVQGPLLQQISDLNREGQVLSDPNNWDGRLAAQFRAHWAETHQKLLAIRDALEELRRQIAQINQNIMQAGGQ
jgi:uncharacterized protein YukE